MFLGSTIDIGKNLKYEYYLVQIVDPITSCYGDRIFNLYA